MGPVGIDAVRNQLRLFSHVPGDLVLEPEPYVVFDPVVEAEAGSGNHEQTTTVGDGKNTPPPRARGCSQSSHSVGSLSAHSLSGPGRTMPSARRHAPLPNQWPDSGLPSASPTAPACPLQDDAASEACNSAAPYSR